MIGIAVVAITVLTVILFAVLRSDKKRAERGEESYFWEVDE